jgi:hypothetical protein
MKIIHALKIGMLTLLIVGCNDNGFKSRTITIEGHKLELSANKFAGGLRIKIKLAM